ncbi:response regulator [Cohnella terricola]|uniref:Response regulator n=1 Tax=Cohnella terricola TaxID=1289167 RepID=A0A559JSW4_9BACL|nr:response regulator [Cohnella terricola]TVY02978.1 response regulator [Cohnella terricola]
MYKVVVIDDQPFVRDALVRTVNWERLQCCVVATASDGDEGKRVIMEHRPDLVISDIRLPGADGIELSEFIRKRLPDNQIILITGYQDFEYARRALKLGVIDFIVKPIKNAELEEAIRKAVQAIRISREKEKTLPGYEGHLFLSALRGEANGTEEFREHLRIRGFEGHPKLLLLGRRKEEVETEPFSLLDYVKDSPLLGSGRFLVLETHYEGCQALLAIASSKSASDPSSWTSLKRTIHEGLRDKLGVAFSLAASPMFTDLGDLPDMNSAAMAALQSLFFKPAETLAIATPVWHEPRTVLHESFLREIDAWLETADDDDSLSLDGLSRLLEQVERHADGDIQLAIAWLTEIFLSLVRYGIKSDRTGTETPMEDDVQSSLKQIARLRDMAEGRALLEGVVRQFNDKSRQAASGYSLIVRSVLSQIQTQYAENMTLTDLAERYRISSAYLSRLLKKETGHNFVDLLTKARIQAAKKWLADPAISVQQVASLVGYGDYSYFYQVFKKYEGISPSEVKKKPR